MDATCAQEAKLRTNPKLSHAAATTAVPQACAGASGMFGTSTGVRAVGQSNHVYPPPPPPAPRLLIDSAKRFALAWKIRHSEQCKLFVSGGSHLKVAQTVRGC